MIHVTKIRGGKAILTKTTQQDKKVMIVCIVTYCHLPERDSFATVPVLNTWRHKRERQETINQSTWERAIRGDQLTLQLKLELMGPQLVSVFIQSALSSINEEGAVREVLLKQDNTRFHGRYSILNPRQNLSVRPARLTILFTCYLNYICVASELFATYPLRLHLTKLPDHKDESVSSLPKALNCYVLGYGGGMISGDVNELSIKVKPHSKLVVTSQSTSKAFKAVEGRGATCVRTRAKVAIGGLLFLVPQPTQCFGGSILTLNTEVTLEGIGRESFSENDDPSLLLVDWYTGGRENLDGGRWQLSSFHSRTAVSICASEYFSDDEVSNLVDGTRGQKSKLVFRDSTRLSGGIELQKHMRNYNVICMVVLLGPKLKDVASKFLTNYSSRREYDDDSENGQKDNYKSFKSSKTMDYNQGEGLNRQDEGLLVSCGTFQTCEEGRFQTGVVVRLAANTLEIAGMLLLSYLNICLLKL
jgi:urease accessory protein UreH